MEASEGLRVGDVVQLDPTVHAASEESPGGFFAGCFMLVTEVKSWGAQGFVSIPTERGKPPGAAYFRSPWSQMEKVGRAAWTLAGDGLGPDWEPMERKAP